MNSLPAWWTFFGHPDFRKQTFHFAWPEICVSHVSHVIIIQSHDTQNMNRNWLHFLYVEFNFAIFNNVFIE